MGIPLWRRPLNRNSERRDTHWSPLAAMLGTSSSLNANPYAANGAAGLLTQRGQFPTIFGRRLERGWSVALFTAALVLVFASAFDLTAIASLGSAVALAVFLMVTVSHYRRKEDTGAKGWILDPGGSCDARDARALCDSYPGRRASDLRGHDRYIRTGDHHELWVEDLSRLPSQNRCNRGCANRLIG